MRATSRSRGRGPNKTVLSLQKEIAASPEYLFNSTTDLHDWYCNTGNSMRDIRRAEREHVALEKLREEREELESVHEKEANKYRNGGRKVREEKAAVRFVEMEKLLEHQNRVCMEMNEVQTRLNSHASSKYERAIEKTEAQHKLLHDPNFDYARPIGRILMVKLRRLKRDPRALMKVSMAIRLAGKTGLGFHFYSYLYSWLRPVQEIAAHGSDPCVVEAALHLIEAELLTFFNDQLVSRCVTEGFCDSIVSVMKVEEWTDNVFLQTVCINLTSALCCRSVEARTAFGYYPFVYLTRILHAYSSDPAVLVPALSAMGNLCQQCPLQRRFGFDAGATAGIISLMNEWKRDWRVINASLAAVEGLICRCPVNKSACDQAAVRLVLDVMQEYSGDRCFENFDVCGVVVRSCLLLIRAFMSRDDNGVTEVFEYDKYVEAGGVPVQGDTDPSVAQAKKDQFFAKKEAARRGEVVEDASPIVEESEGLKKLKEIVECGGILRIVDCARYHAADPRTALFFLQTLHVLQYNHATSWWPLEGLSSSPDIVNLVLSYLVSFRDNPVIMWWCLTNLTLMCERGDEPIASIEAWGKGGADDEGSIDEYAEVKEEDESISGGKVSTRDVEVGDSL